MIEISDMYNLRRFFICWPRLHQPFIKQSMGRTSMIKMPPDFLYTDISYIHRYIYIYVYIYIQPWIFVYSENLDKSFLTACGIMRFIGIVSEAERSVKET
jgi:hypothetical protein